MTAHPFRPSGQRRRDPDCRRASTGPTAAVDRRAPLGDATNAPTSLTVAGCPGRPELQPKPYDGVLGLGDAAGLARAASGSRIHRAGALPLPPLRSPVIDRPRFRDRFGVGAAEPPGSDHGFLRRRESPERLCPPGRSAPHLRSHGPARAPGRPPPPLPAGRRPLRHGLRISPRGLSGALPQGRAPCGPRPTATADHAQLTPAPPRRPTRSRKDVPALPSRPLLWHVGYHRLAVQTDPGRHRSRRPRRQRRLARRKLRHRPDPLRALGPLPARRRPPPPRTALAPGG
jgi:hypothetical protein